MARRPDHVDVADLLEAAVAHAKISAWTDAAVAVIAAWRRAPSARLAALLVAIEKPLPPPTPLRGTTVAERESSWHALADTKDDQFLASLLHEQWPVHPKGAKLRVAKHSKRNVTLRGCTVFLAPAVLLPCPGGVEAIVRVPMPSRSWQPTQNDCARWHAEQSGLPRRASIAWVRT